MCSLSPARGRALRLTACAAALAVCLLLPTTSAAQQVDTLLTLQEAIALAIEANPGIQIVRTEARIAENNYTRGNAGYLPQVGADLRQTRVNGTPRDGHSMVYDLALGANYTIFDGFRRAATYERLEAQRELAGVQARSYTEATLADLITLYYDLARQQQQIDVLRETISVSRERLRIAELGLEVGSISELEVRRARVDLNADQAALLRQQSALASSQARLSELMGQHGARDYRVTNVIDVDSTLDVEQLYAEAQQENPNLQRARTSREVAEASRREIRAEWYPQLNLQAGYIFNQLPDNIGVGVQRPSGFSYGLSVNFDIFQGYNRSRRLQNAQLQLGISDLEINESVLQLRSDLESAYFSYRNYLDLVTLEETNVALAEQNVAVALERYRLGGISSIELREVQNALIDAQSRAISARFEAKRAEITLLELSGRLRALASGV